VTERLFVGRFRKRDDQHPPLKQARAGAHTGGLCAGARGCGQPV